MKSPVKCAGAHARNLCRLLCSVTLPFAALYATPCQASTQHPYVNWITDYTGEAGEVLNGGLARRGAYAGQFELGADVDMNQLFGWEGATLHIRGVNRHGENLSTKGVGNSTSPQEDYGGENTRLVRFTIEQKLFNDRLVLSGGRTSANPNFLHSDQCIYFQTNAACGSPKYIFENSGFSWWPTSSWGFHAKAWLTSEVYFHAGVFEVNHKREQNSDHGLDWGIDGATGVNVPFALGYKTDFTNDTHPRMFEIGGWYDSATYSDPLNDDYGHPAVTSGNDYTTRVGRSGYFVRLQQMIWRPDLTSQRGLTVFGTFFGNVSGRAVESDFEMVGMVLKGALPTRPRDTLSFIVTRQGYSGIEMENLRLARESAGGSQPLHSDQYMMELNYGFYLTPQIHIEPNLQYIIHPDQLNDTTRIKNLPSALVFGLRFTTDLADAFGFNR